MNDISVLDRIKVILDIITSQSLFVTLFAIIVMTVVVLIINIRIKSKAPRIAAAIIYAGLALLVLIRYGSYVLSLNDSVVDKFFKAMYFPNMVVYLSMLIVTMLLLAITIINEKLLKVTKICNISAFCLIWFLFIMLIDTIKKENLNFYEVKDLYANEQVMILLQASMSIFVVWLGVMLMDVIVRRLSEKMDKNDELKASKVPEYIETNTKQETNIEDYQRYL